MWWALLRCNLLDSLSLDGPGWIVGVNLERRDEVLQKREALSRNLTELQTLQLQESCLSEFLEELLLLVPKILLLENSALSWLLQLI